MLGCREKRKGILHSVKSLCKSMQVWEHLRKSQKLERLIRKKICKTETQRNWRNRQQPGTEQTETINTLKQRDTYRNRDRKSEARTAALETTEKWGKGG